MHQSVRVTMFFDFLLSLSNLPGIKKKFLKHAVMEIISLFCVRKFLLISNFVAKLQEKIGSCVQGGFVRGIS